MFDVKVKLNKTRLALQIRDKIDFTQMALDDKVLSDSNYFIPVLTSTMEKSSIIQTRIGTGLIVWQTLYVRKQYYEDIDHSKQNNPNATMKWFETAKMRYIKDWEKLANDKFRCS